MYMKDLFPNNTAWWQIHGWFSQNYRESIELPPDWMTFRLCNKMANRYRGRVKRQESPRHSKLIFCTTCMRLWPKQMTAQKLLDNAFYLQSHTTAYPLQSAHISCFRKIATVCTISSRTKKEPTATPKMYIQVIYSIETAVVDIDKHLFGPNEYFFCFPFVNKERALKQGGIVARIVPAPKVSPFYFR